MSVLDSDQFHQQNIRLVHRFYEALSHKNIPALLACLDENVTWYLEGPPAIPFAGKHQGREAIDQMIHCRLACAQCLDFRVCDLHAATNHVTVTGHESARSRHTGQSWTADWLHLHTIHSGKITKIREHTDTAAILLAFKS
jgi:hypothetical protein